MREPVREIEVDVSKVDVGDNEVLVLRPNKKPVVQTYQKTAEQVTYALQQSALRDGVRKALGHIDGARSCFASAMVARGKMRDKEFTMGAEALERSLRDLCEAVGIPLPDFPDGVKTRIEAAKRGEPA